MTANLIMLAVWVSSSLAPYLWFARMKQFQGIRHTFLGHFDQGLLKELETFVVPLQEVFSERIVDLPLFAEDF
jgi:hypothetical protein